MNAATHPWLVLSARYRAVLSAAWQVRHELSGPQRLRDETAFLPAALSLQETPVHPAPRRAAWALCALFTAAIVWSVLGEVDMVAVAPGRIIVSERSKVIQPLETGTVKTIHVQDGSKVKAGQVLIELDATQADSDRQRIQQDKQAALTERLRAEALLAALENQHPIGLPSDSGLSRTESAQALQQLRAEWADIQAKLQKLNAEETRRLTEIETVEQQVRKLRATLPMAQQRETDYRTLTEQGYLAGHLGQDRTRERVELEADLAALLARKQEISATLEETRRAREAYHAETLNALRERQTQARLKFNQLHEDAAKANQRSRLMTLTAPVDGTVQQLAVHTTGGVVTSAQNLMVIVPSSPSLTAEVTLENKDIGFVQAGQTAQIKIEALPFTRYGTVAAKIVQVSEDAVIDDKRGAIFMTTLELDNNFLVFDNKSIKLTPGMNISAEIKTGKRTLMEYITNPIIKVMTESIRER